MAGRRSRTVAWSGPIRREAARPGGRSAVGVAETAALVAVLSLMIGAPSPATPAEAPPPAMALLPLPAGMTLAQARGGGGVAHGSGRAGSAEGVRLIDVEPILSGGLLSCRLRAEGLPGRRAAFSLESGLVAALDLTLDLLDRQREIVAGNSVRLRLAHDLWEEVYTVAGAGLERRFATFAQLQSFLDQLPRLAVAPAAKLPGQEPLQVRVGLVVHPVAPSERERVEEVITSTGGSRPEEHAQEDGRQVTVGLSRLIRFFYRGASDRPEPQATVLSSLFRLEDLHDAAD